ncbi:MAG: Crp/Fnr family transcriptional regulator [Thermodesulfobacteriota bacterium]
MEPVLDIMARAPLFNGLSRDQLEALHAIGTVHMAEKGQTIFEEGEAADGFYVLLFGKIKVYKSSMDGKEHILHILGPGEPFGEVPVFIGANFPATAVATTPSKLLFFPRKRFIDLISQNPSIALGMIGLLCLRLKEFTHQIENLALKDVAARLASYLLALLRDQRTSSNRSIRLTISKSQLAGVLGTVPETLSRVFSRLSSAGYIRVQGPEITVLNPEGLQEVVTSGKWG